MDIQRVRRSGRVVRHPLVVMILDKSEESICRIGVISSKAVGNAVNRNRAKRLIRHAVNPLLPMVQAGWDVMLIARAPIAASNYQQVSEALCSLFKRSGILIDHEISSH